MNTREIMTYGWAGRTNTRSIAVYGWAVDAVELGLFDDFPGLFDGGIWF